MTRDKYLSAIIPLMKEEGLDMSMETVAQRIGVSKKTLYNRFSSKEQMIEDCLEMLFNKFKEDLSCMDDDSIPIDKRFVTGIVTLRLFFKDMSPAFMRDLMKYYPQKASLSHTVGLNYFEDKIAQNIEQGKKEGVYLPQIDSGLFAKYISFSIFSFFQKEVMMANTYSSSYYFDQVIQFNINALLI